MNRFNSPCSGIISKHPEAIARVAKDWVREYQEEGSKAEAMAKLMTLVAQVGGGLLDQYVGASIRWEEGCMETSLWWRRQAGGKAGRQVGIQYINPRECMGL